MYRVRTAKGMAMNPNAARHRAELAAHRASLIPEEPRVSERRKPSTQPGLTKDWNNEAKKREEKRLEEATKIIQAGARGAEARRDSKDAGLAEKQAAVRAAAEEAQAKQRAAEEKRLREQAEAAWDATDLNGDGYVDRHELKTMMEKAIEMAQVRVCVARARSGVRGLCAAGCGSTGASGPDSRRLAQIKTSSEIVEAFAEAEWGRVMAEFDEDNNELLSKEEFVAHFVSFHKRLNEGELKDEMREDDGPIAERLAAQHDAPTCA